MKIWQDMDKFEKIQAVRDAYFHGCFAREIADAIPGATDDRVRSLYKKNRRALSDCPLGVKGAGIQASPKEPVISAEQIPGIVKQRQEGKTLDEIASGLGTSISSVRRAFERYGVEDAPRKKRADPVNRVTSAHEEPVHVMERYKARVSADLGHPLSRLIHEGPSPERRQLMAEGVI